MPNHARKPPSDPDRAALAIVQQATADEELIEVEIEAEAETAYKDPATSVIAPIRRPSTPESN